MSEPLKPTAEDIRAAVPSVSELREIITSLPRSVQQAVSTSFSRYNLHGFLKEELKKEKGKDIKNMDKAASVPSQPDQSMNIAPLRAPVTAASTTTDNKGDAIKGGGNQVAVTYKSSASVGILKSTSGGKIHNLKSVGWSEWSSGIGPKDQSGSKVPPSTTMRRTSSLVKLGEPRLEYRPHFVSTEGLGDRGPIATEETKSLDTGLNTKATLEALSQLTREEGLVPGGLQVPPAMLNSEEAAESALAEIGVKGDNSDMYDPPSPQPRSYGQGDSVIAMADSNRLIQAQVREIRQILEDVVATQRKLRQGQETILDKILGLERVQMKALEEMREIASRFNTAGSYLMAASPIPMPRANNPSEYGASPDLGLPQQAFAVKPQGLSNLLSVMSNMGNVTQNPAVAKEAGELLEQMRNISEAPARATQFGGTSASQKVGRQAAIALVDKSKLPPALKSRTIGQIKATMNPDEISGILEKVGVLKK